MSIVAHLIHNKYSVYLANVVHVVPEIEIYRDTEREIELHSCSFLLIFLPRYWNHLVFPSRSMREYNLGLARSDRVGYYSASVNRLEYG